MQYLQYNRYQRAVGRHHNLYGCAGDAVQKCRETCFQSNK